MSSATHLLFLTVPALSQSKEEGRKKKKLRGICQVVFFFLRQGFGSLLMFILSTWNARVKKRTDFKYGESYVLRIDPFNVSILVS